MMLPIPAFSTAHDVPISLSISNWSTADDNDGAPKPPPPIVKRRV